MEACKGACAQPGTPPGREESEGSKARDETTSDPNFGIW